MLKEYKIQDGETIFDIVLATYGTLDYTYKLISENSLAGDVFYLQSIDADLSTATKRTLRFDSAFEAQEDVYTTKENINPPDYSYLIQEGQSLFDVAIMVYGDVSKVIQIIQDHKRSISQLPIENVNQSVLAGIRITYDPSMVEDKVLVEYLRSNNLVVNTSDPKVNPGNGFTSGFVMEAFF
jgi:hypothetical protein